VRLKLDTSWRRVRVEFLANPGDEIDVPDEIAHQLMRSSEHWRPAEGLARRASRRERPAEEPEE
jgi:hypothetical protein